VVGASPRASRLARSRRSSSSGSHGGRLRRRTVAPHTPWRYGLPERPSAALATAVDRSRVRDMQTTPRTKPHREIGRLAIGAGLVAF
jgi:hypothetical protein